MKEGMKIYLIGFLAVLMILSCGCGFVHGLQRGRIIETWETGNGVFKVRVTAYEERNIFPSPSGAHYMYESTAIGSENWRQFMTFRHDDPIPIPREQIRFASSQVGYVFVGWMYAVTTDSGSNWSVWNAKEDLLNWQCCNYKLIQDVHLKNDGIGMMRLNPITQRRGEVPELHTVNYGQHWEVKH